MNPSLPVWLELHVDDFLLAENPARWPDSAAVLDRVAGLAEAAGARVSFRIMETFARGDRSGFLRDLARRGHEVGWHTHGKHVADAIAALEGAGILDAARIGTPGLVQVGDRGREALLREAQAAGLKVITDRLTGRYHAYQGWLAWEALPGLVSLDVSIDPFDWGVLHRRGKKVLHAWGSMDWERLRARIAAREREVPPPGEAAFFGATLHEHNLCAEGTLTPVPRAMEGLARFLDGLGQRVVPSASVLRGSRWESGRLDPPEDTRHDPTLANLRRGWQRVSARLTRAPFRPTERERADGTRGPLVVAPGAARERHEVPAFREDFWLDLPGRRLAVRRVGLASARAVVVAVHGGKSGIEQGLSFLGLPEDALVAQDVALYTFARSEGARTPGNPVHVEDTAAVIRHALAEGPPVGLLTWSAGVVPALRALLEHELRGVRFLVDCEGPCDRFSVVPPRQPKHELASADVNDDDPWEGREAIRYIAAFPGRYHRVQAGVDHVHGPMVAHARRMVAAADGRLNEAGEILAGHLWGHGTAVSRWIGEHAAAAR